MQDKFSIAYSKRGRKKLQPLLILDKEKIMGSIRDMLKYQGFEYSYDTSH